MQFTKTCCIQQIDVPDKLKGITTIHEKYGRDRYLHCLISFEQLLSNNMQNVSTLKQEKNFYK